MDDRQIIELYNQRDENAIKETSDKYGNYCFSIANNILACKQDSEECVHDAWLQTRNSIPPQKPNCLKAFLAKITRNLSLNRYKEKTRDKRGNGEVVLTLDEMDEFLAGTSISLMHSISREWNLPQKQSRKIVSKADDYFVEGIRGFAHIVIVLDAGDAHVPLGTGIFHKEALDIPILVDEGLAGVPVESAAMLTIKAGGADAQIHQLPWG